LAANFSPMPRIGPPAFGRPIRGGVNGDGSAPGRLWLVGTRGRVSHARLWFNKAEPLGIRGRTAARTEPPDPLPIQEEAIRSISAIDMPVGRSACDGQAELIHRDLAPGGLALDREFRLPWKPQAFVGPLRLT
jgi:hypothetical protein